MRLPLRRESPASAEIERVIGAIDLSSFVPAEVLPLNNPQTDIPRIAKDERLIRLIEEAVKRIPTRHRVNHGDARSMDELQPNSVHLVSPPRRTGL
jgi:modification methylase